MSETKMKAKKALGYVILGMFMPLYAMLYVGEYAYLIGKAKRAGLSWGEIRRMLRRRKR
jgi:hypothetical protein